MEFQRSLFYYFFYKIIAFGAVSVSHESLQSHILTLQPFVTISFGSYHWRVNMYPWLQQDSPRVHWVEMPSPRILAGSSTLSCACLFCFKLNRIGGLDETAPFYLLITSAKAAGKMTLSCAFPDAPFSRGLHQLCALEPGQSVRSNKWYNELVLQVIPA